MYRCQQNSRSSLSCFSFVSVLILCPVSSSEVCGGLCSLSLSLLFLCLLAAVGLVCDTWKTIRPISHHIASHRSADACAAARKKELIRKTASDFCFDTLRYRVDRESDRESDRERISNNHKRARDERERETRTHKITKKAIQKGERRFKNVSRVAQREASGIIIINYFLAEADAVDCFI